MSDQSKREFFDREAHEWNQRSHQDDDHRIRQLVEGFDLRPGDRVLDVGTGNGVLLPHLLEKVSCRGQVLALDFSWKMICEAARITQMEEVRLINASVEALPFADRTFDCVTCMDTFAHVDGKREALEEMSRILKRGGRLYIVHTLGKAELARHHGQIGGVVLNDVLPPNRSMRAMMEKAGLKDVRIADQPDLYLAHAKR